MKTSTGIICRTRIEQKQQLVLTNKRRRNSSGDEIPKHDIGSYTPLTSNSPDGTFPWDDLRNILQDQRMAKIQNG